MRPKSLLRHRLTYRVNSIERLTHEFNPKDVPEMIDKLGLPEIIHKSKVIWKERMEEDTRQIMGNWLQNSFGKAVSSGLVIVIEGQREYEVKISKTV